MCQCPGTLLVFDFFITEPRTDPLYGFQESTYTTILRCLLGLWKVRAALSLYLTLVYDCDTANL